MGGHLLVLGSSGWRREMGSCPALGKGCGSVQLNAYRGAGELWRIAGARRPEYCKTDLSWGGDMCLFNPGREQEMDQSLTWWASEFYLGVISRNIAEGLLSGTWVAQKQPVTEKPTTMWVTAKGNCNPGAVCTTCRELDMVDSFPPFGCQSLPPAVPHSVRNPGEGSWWSWA